MKMNSLVFSVSLFIATNSYAGISTNTPSEFERSLADKVSEITALKQSKLDLEQNLTRSQKEVGEKNTLIDQYQKILEDKNTVARNMQFNSNGVDWSWISFCDSWHLTGGIFPLCRYSKDEVGWANSLLGHGLSADIQSNYRRLVVLICMYSALGFFFICILLGISYYLFKTFLGGYKDPLRYELDTEYRLEVDKSFQNMRIECQMQLNKLEDKSVQFLKKIEISQTKLDNLNQLAAKKEEEIESLEAQAKILNVKAQKIIDEQIEVISSAAVSDKERRELIKRKLSG